MNKIDFILLFDATDANPNGDPDLGNRPRVDPESEHGIVTDVCIKRKVRNYVQLTRSGAKFYDIFVREGAILNEIIEKTYTASDVDFADDDTECKKQEKVIKWLCKNFYDIRTFGAVLSTGKNAGRNAGQVRGPVQISFARSINPIHPHEYTITRCAVTKKEDAEKERAMGFKHAIPYGLYLAKGTVNPFLAKLTEFGEEDLNLLIEALTHMFDFDASAARPAGSMAVRKLILFRHDSELGNAPAHKLYECLDIKLKDGVEVPRSIADYDISVSPAPAGVSIEEVDC